jgi:hypothetical protein
MYIKPQAPYILAYFCTTCEEFHYENGPNYDEHFEFQKLPNGIMKVARTRHPCPEKAKVYYGHDVTMSSEGLAPYSKGR